MLPQISESRFGFWLSSRFITRTLRFAVILIPFSCTSQILAQNANTREPKTGTVELISKSHKLGLPPKYDINRIGNRGIGSGPNRYSLAAEQELGRSMAKEVEQQNRLITDPVITEYVNRLGEKLVRNSDAKMRFTIRVIASDEINAFALPGGYLFVNAGLILAVENESQLAGLMAHEIAHVAARHATRKEKRTQVWRYASLPLACVGGPAAIILQAAVLTKFSRDMEREADLLGLQYEYAAGYDPQAFVEFFEKLRGDEKQKETLLAKAFLTHPVTIDRIRRAQEEVLLLPGKAEYVIQTSDFEEAKAKLAGLMADNARPVLHRRIVREEIR